MFKISSEKFISPNVYEYAKFLCSEAEQKFG